MNNSTSQAWSNSKPPTWLFNSVMGLVFTVIIGVFSLALTHPVPTTQACLQALHQKYQGTITQDPENPAIYYIRQPTGEVLRIRVGSNWGPSTDVAQETVLIPSKN